MAASPYEILLPPLPGRRDTGFYWALVGGFTFLLLLFGAADLYFWHNQITPMGLALLLPCLMATIALGFASRDLNSELGYNRRLPDMIAQQLAAPLPPELYGQFVSTAERYPEVQPWIAEALVDRDSLTVAEARALAGRINAYLAGGAQRKLIAMARTQQSLAGPAR